MAPRPGFELPLLLIGGFRTLIDELHERLAARGHPDARPLHGFALQAIGPGGASTSELARRLGVSKQAAAKTVARLEALGYVTRTPDPDDARASVVRVAEQGRSMLSESAAIFEDLRREFAAQVGDARVTAIEDDLAKLVSGAGGAKLGDLPGWLG